MNNIDFEMEDLGNEEKTTWRPIVTCRNGLFFSERCHGATQAN
jgi:hypothetical protein